MAMILGNLPLQYVPQKYNYKLGKKDNLETLRLGSRRTLITRLCLQILNLMEPTEPIEFFITIQLSN